jgi:hypothetical protein
MNLFKLQLETGIYEDYYYHGIQNGPAFRKVRVLYKLDTPDCEENPEPWIIPIYEGISNEPVGRSGEIKRDDGHIFYKWKTPTKKLVKRQYTQKLKSKLPAEIVDYEVEPYLEIE